VADAETTATAKEANMSSVRILFVDDCEEDVFLSIHEMQRAGLDVTAQTVMTAVDLANAVSAFHPDIILSDMSLPGFSGFEALKIAATIDPSIPVVILCGCAEHYGQHACESGASAVIDKDHMDELPGCIQAVIGVGSALLS
jgi:CheY-like chemotaxis protein